MPIKSFFPNWRPQPRSADAQPSVKAQIAGIDAPTTIIKTPLGSKFVVAFVWIDRNAREWTQTLRSVLRINAVSEVHVGLAPGQNKSEIKLEDAKLNFLEDKSFRQAARAALATKAELFLYVSAPVLAPADALDNAIVWMNNDPRVGTISFLSNSAGYLSFPHRNTETPFGVDGHDEATVTALLRSRLAASKRRPVPLPVAEGGMIVVSRNIWEVCGDLDDAETQNAAFGIAELSLRASRRGFNNYLDPFTFISRPWDGVGSYSSVLDNPEARHALYLRHHHFPGCHDMERNRPDSVLGEALDVARAKALGLRVLIDGSVLGPKEMGTQVLITQLAAGLAHRPEIRWVVLAVPDPSDLPQYAQPLGMLEKIRFVPAANLEFHGAPDVDIIHRPFQPASPIPWDRWRQLSKRSIITIQDLIAYRNGTYFKDWESWEEYRGNFRRQVAQADAIISISHDVVTSIREERMPIDENRLFVIHNGADGRSKEQRTRIPEGILQRGWVARRYLIVLGATYAHKNRDLAMRVWAQLRQKGFDYAMILVGATVPFGSSRTDEAVLDTEHLQPHILALPEVGSEERNWLLQNASLVIYLTSAEGFGLVPFEAAQVGVPTLFVSFGPLRELIEDPELPRSYDVGELTARAEVLLTDVSAARESIKKILKNLDLTWAEGARKSVDAYFETLDQPARTLRS